MRYLWFIIISKNPNHSAKSPWSPPACFESMYLSAPEWSSAAGKYSKSYRPSGPRSATFSDRRLESVEPLLSLMKDIGSAHSDKTLSQVPAHCLPPPPPPGCLKNPLPSSAAAIQFQ